MSSIKILLLLLRAVQITREASSKISVCLTALMIHKDGKSEFWEKKTLDNKSLLPHSSVQYHSTFLLVICITFLVQCRGGILLH